MFTQISPTDYPKIGVALGAAVRVWNAKVAPFKALRLFGVPNRARKSAAAPRLANVVARFRRAISAILDFARCREGDPLDYVQVKTRRLAKKSL